MIQHHPNDIQDFLDGVANDDKGTKFGIQMAGIAEMFFDRGTLTPGQLTAVFASAGRQGKAIPQALRDMRRGRAIAETPTSPSHTPEPMTYDPHQTHQMAIGHTDSTIQALNSLADAFLAIAQVLIDAADRIRK